MKIIDAGHKYEVDIYDSTPEGQTSTITFMKRIGEGYPGNTSEYPGTNCQELIRVLIDRVTYLNAQIYSQNNDIILQKLRESLWLFEDRAAIRHGFRSEDIDFRPDDIEKEQYCHICGHVLCKGH